MGLVKCPDCGKMISDRVEGCPNCGCPREFFGLDSNQQVSSNNIVTTNIPNEVITPVKEELITFSIAGKEISCKKGNNLMFANRFGEFIFAAENAKNRVLISYYMHDTIEDILSDVPEVAAEKMDEAIEKAMGMLFAFGVSMSTDQFMAKYYNMHNMDFGVYYENIVDKYSEIMDLRDEMAAYRKMKEDSHKGWVGGGFGLKGAVKGAITASILNGVSGVIHSEAAGRARDKQEIQNRLQNLYSSSRKYFADGLEECIVNVYLSVKEELVSRNIIDSAQFELDKKKADVLYNNVLKYNNDSTRKINELITCIQLFPGEKNYYNEIIDDIFDGIQRDGDSFHEYLSYWGLLHLYSVPDNMEKELIEGKKFIEKIQSLLNKKELADVYSDIDIKRINELSATQRKDLFHRTGMFYNGTYLLYEDKDMVLTDYLLLFDEEPICIRELENIECDEEDDWRVLKCLDEDFRVDTEHNLTSDEFGLRKLIGLVNYGIDADDAEDFIESLTIDFEFDKQVERLDLPDGITDIDSYLKYREAFSIVTRNTEKIPSSLCKSYIKVLNQLVSLSNDTKKKLYSSPKYYSWFNMDGDIDNLIYSIELDRRLKLTPEKIWTSNSNGLEKEKPDKNQQALRTVIGDIVISMQGKGTIYTEYNMPEGFGITTEKKIICYKDNTAFDGCDIKIISAKNSYEIEIGDQNRHGIIECDGETDRDFIINLLRTFCIKISNNVALWSEEWGDKPTEEKKPKEKSEFEKKFIEYIKECGLEDILIRERMDSLSDSKLKEKLRFQVNTNPHQKLLYYRDMLYVSDQILGIGTYCARADSIIGVDFVLNAPKGEEIRIYTKDDEKFRVEMPVAEPEVINAINYALDFYDTEKTKQAMLQSELVKTIKTTLREYYELENNAIFKANVQLDSKKNGVLYFQSDKFVFIYDENNQKMDMPLDKIKRIDYKNNTLYIQPNGTLLYYVFGPVDKFQDYYNKIVPVLGGGLCYSASNESSADNKGKNKEQSVIVSNNELVEKHNENKIDSNSNQKMFCPFCGEKIEVTAAFCNFCGKENPYKK